MSRIYKRTPETRKKTSESIKKWWANRKEEDIIATRRKMSAARQERQAKIPPRAKADIYKKKTESQKAFYQTYEGRECRKYIGYLAKKDILECDPKKKECIMEKKIEGMCKAWANYTPEQRENRVKVVQEAKRKSYKKVQYLFEHDVPRKKTYCGVVEMEQMYG